MSGLNGSPRPPATLRKEVIETPSFGELVVCGLRASAKARAWAVPPVDGESPEEYEQRSRLLFESRFLAESVTDSGGRPLYTADEWDILLGGPHRAELQPVIDKVLELNGAGAAGEAAAKNA